MPDAVVTRVPAVRPRRKSRTLEERLMVRFPRAFQRQFAAAIRLLPRRSRLRRVLLRRAVVSGWASANRGDFDVMLVRYAPDVEITFDPSFEPLGLTGPYRGHDGVIEMIRGIEDAWPTWELKPVAAVDLGDRVVLLGTLRVRGNVSGMELESEISQLQVARDGLVGSQRDFLSWDDGLRAAGLDPAAIALPPRPAAARASRTAGLSNQA